VFFDATALACDGVCELLLAAADRNLYRPLWTREVLEKIPGPAPNGASHSISISEVFPEACVEGHNSIIDGLTCNESIRTELAAAIVGHAQLIVTRRCELFPEAVLENLHIELRTPDEFLMDLLDRYPDDISACLRFISNQTREPGKPPRLSVYHLLQHIGRTAPKFAAAALLQFQIA
jgi:hypothetical protein